MNLKISYKSFSLLTINIRKIQNWRNNDVTNQLLRDEIFITLQSVYEKKFEFKERMKKRNILPKFRISFYKH